MLPFLIPAAVAIASEVFPNIVTKIAGDRAGEVAEKVVRTAASVADMPADAKPQEILARINADETRRQELRFKLEQLDREEHERILEDRRHAREYQIRAGSRRGNIMLIGVSAGLAFCILAVMWEGALEGTEVGLVTTVAGALLKMLSDAFAFEFGSSRGSKQKDDQILEFKNALMQAGEERDRTAREVIQQQQRRIENAEDKVLQAARLPAAAAAAEEAPASRDFVGDLIAGRVG